IGNFPRQFGEETSALEREDRSPEPIEPNWNDSGVGVLRDQFVTAPQTQESSRAGELPFRKKANDLAGGDLFGRGANCRTRMPDVNRNAADGAHEWAEHRFVIKFLIDDVTNRPRACQLENKRVDPSDVIGQKQKTALGQIFETERADAIKKFDERPAKKMERALTGGNVRHRFLFTISPWRFICQSAIRNGNPRPSCPRRPNCARAVARD